MLQRLPARDRRYRRAARACAHAARCGRAQSHSARFQAPRYCHGSSRARASGVNGRDRRVVVSSITSVARPAAAQTSPLKIVCTTTNELRPCSASAVPISTSPGQCSSLQEIDLLAHQHDRSRCRRRCRDPGLRNSGDAAALEVGREHGVVDVALRVEIAEANDVAHAVRIVVQAAGRVCAVALASGRSRITPVARCIAGRRWRKQGLSTCCESRRLLRRRRDHGGLVAALERIGDEARGLHLLDEPAQIGRGRRAAFAACPSPAGSP